MSVSLTTVDSASNCFRNSSLGPIATLSPFSKLSSFRDCWYNSQRLLFTATTSPGTMSPYSPHATSITGATQNHQTSITNLYEQSTKQLRKSASTGRKNMSYTKIKIIV